MPWLKMFWMPEVEWLRNLWRISCFASSVTISERASLYCSPGVLSLKLVFWPEIHCCLCRACYRRRESWHKWRWIEITSNSLLWRYKKGSECLTELQHGSWKRQDRLCICIWDIRYFVNVLDWIVNENLTTGYEILQSWKHWRGWHYVYSCLYIGWTFHHQFKYINWSKWQALSMDFVLTLTRSRFSWVPSLLVLNHQRLYFYRNWLLGTIPRTQQ